MEVQCGRPGFSSWVGKILWRREWQPIPVLLPGESHGQRSLAGYHLWGHGESDLTEGATNAQRNIQGLGMLQKFLKIGKSCVFRLKPIPAARTEQDLKKAIRGLPILMNLRTPRTKIKS